MHSNTHGSARRCATLCAALLVAACGGGGGGGGPGTTLSFQAAAGTAVEGGAPLVVTVVLHTDEAALTKVVRVTVADAGSGTASSGADYAAFAPVTMTFPVGSGDGDAQQATLAALDDQLVEGADETVHLALVNPVSAGLSGASTFTARLDDIHFATLEFGSATSSTPDESSAPRAVSIRLDLPPGVALGAPARARVSNAGGGSATSGADFAAIAAANVTFPAGSADGATLDFTVDVLDDSAIEADETVRLALGQPVAGTLVGALALHQLTITDDDASGSPALVVTEGPTGVENVLASNDLLALGTRAVGAGPSAGTLVRLSNAGGAALDLGAPRITGSHPGDFSVVVESAPLAPPPAPGAAGFELAADVAPPWRTLEGSSTPGVQLAILRDGVAELGRATRATVSGFPAPGLGELTLALERKPLPLAPGAVLRVDGADVPGGIAGAVGDLSLWTGHVLEIPGAKVFLALSSRATHGFVELPGTTDRFVHLFTEREGTDERPARCRVVRGPELAQLGSRGLAELCGGERAVPGAGVQVAALAPPPIQPLTAADCRLAIETDWQLFQKFGSAPLATTYVTELVAAVADRYLVDVQTTLSIAYLGLYTTPADPWDAQDSGGDASDVLDEFRAAWAGAWPASANLAHFLSGASLGGGVAYVNVLCNQSFGFGVSGNLSGSIDWQTWTGAPGNFTWDFVVVAHELGHNFGSSHTHSYCPPLDVCSTNCSGPTACSQGTLMSYCHTCGGMDNIDLVFHPVCANAMRQAVNSSCLGLSALAAGDHVQYQVRFDPTATGARSANLDCAHDAPNQPTPFRVRLSGTGN